MRPEVLQNEFSKILSTSFRFPLSEEPCHGSPESYDDGPENVFSLSESDMFKLWNILGEELGIDLSLATPEQRHLLFEACQNGRHLSSKDFSSLLWLVYYSDGVYQ